MKQADLEKEILRFMRLYEESETKAVLSSELTAILLSKAVNTIKKISTHVCRQCGSGPIEKQYQLCGDCMKENQLDRYQAWLKAGRPTKNRYSKKSEKWRGYTSDCAVLPAGSSGY